MLDLTQQVSVSVEEREGMNLIITKISCAEQALKMLPHLKDYSREELILYIRGAIDNLAEARFLETVWWLDILQKYTLIGHYTFDTGRGILVPVAIKKGC